MDFKGKIERCQEVFIGKFGDNPYYYIFLTHHSIFSYLNKNKKIFPNKPGAGKKFCLSPFLSNGF